MFMFELSADAIEKLNKSINDYITEFARYARCYDVSESDVEDLLAGMFRELAICFYALGYNNANQQSR